jgi:hypothetical protein
MSRNCLLASNADATIMAIEAPKTSQAATRKTNPTPMLESAPVAWIGSDDEAAAPRGHGSQPVTGRGLAPVIADFERLAS